MTAQIFHNGTLVWHHTFGAAELGGCSPGPNDGCAGGLSIGVMAGDRIYVKASSPVDPAALELGIDTVKDDLIWAATFTYAGLSAAQASERQPYGALTFQTSLLGDFRLAGLPKVPFVAPAQGKVVIDGVIDKNGTTSDNVHVSITRNGNTNEVFALDFGAGQTDQVGVTGEFDVQSGHQLFFNVLSDSQIDPQRVAWQPSVRYTEYCRLDRDTAQEICAGRCNAAPSRSTIHASPAGFKTIPIRSSGFRWV